ncbi:hypothetical protein DES40_0322 [Litorimonas taeanensis]|uniref:Calcineurin-like phosphoesterase domain-containing protein n=1 Tax=Litorimonas taeanensis TaxID=568099 RepID=A0A420WJ10_9PROT|nr:metallophosphoesterase [Litorimonas taeanensis]RKQ71014.1 hypothetical protein DES40_0322 [Litorimonas taeanensis]
MKARFFYVICSLVLLATACLIYGFYIEPRRLVLRTVDIESASYKGTPLKIAFVSDIHIGGAPIFSEKVNHIVESVNAQSPDIIMLGGDYINGHTERRHHTSAFNSEIEKGLLELENLTSKYGVYSVIGNHDRWYDAEWTAQYLNQLNINVLENQAYNLGALCIVGLSDFDTAQPSPEAFNGCMENAVPLVLTHSPDAFRYLRSDTALALAGHTHGGQINLPLIGRRVTATEAGKPLAYGVKLVNETPVFITAGIGTSILSARFRAPPEIVIINLQ